MEQRMNDELPQHQQGMSLGVIIDLVPGLDGNTWPRLQFINGITSYVFTLPPEHFMEMLEGIYKQGKQAVDAAKEANSPIQVAHTINPYPNGPPNGSRRR